MQGTPPRGSPRSSRVSGSPGRGLVDLRKQLGLDADRRSFGPEGPEVWVPLGPQWHREVPLRSEALAQERSGSLPRLSGGTDMQDRRW